MGTAVLSPQDCLQRDHESFVGVMYLSTASPGSTKKDVQGRVQSPMASLTSESTRQNSSHAGLPMESSNRSVDPSYLLPAKSNKSNTAHVPVSRSFSTSLSSSAFMSSGLLIPYRPYSDSIPSSIPPLTTIPVPNPSSKFHFLPSRSLSAGPTLHNAHADRERASGGRLCSSADRYPLRSVEGSGLANGLARQRSGFELFSVHENALASKFSDARSSRKGVAFTRQELVNGNGRDTLGDISRRTKEDFVLGNGGVEWDRLRSIGKDANVRKGGMRGLSDNKISVQNSITIPFSALAPSQTQKPEVDGKEFLAELKWRADEASSSNISQIQKGHSFPFSKQGEILARSHSDVSLLQKPIADSLEGWLPTPFMYPFTDSAASGRKGGDDRRKLGSPPDDPFQRECMVSPCKAEIDLQEYLGRSSSSPVHERWAGPAYTNSPPPSSLPLPKFPLKQLRSSSLELPKSSKHFLTDADFSDRSRSCPTVSSPFPVPACDSAVDIAFATKDLRRILHLD
eukprot:c28089_g2_i1 orf=560-2098(+)